MEVDTPILGAVASGATARPFETSATEFPDRRLALRIAPELWLKRLVIGGMERVFEIGPSFRNEGMYQGIMFWPSCFVEATSFTAPIHGNSTFLLSHTTIDCGKQGFPFAQPYLSYRSGG